ncbi:hypothetical protein F2Q69_00008377 [Brassica cretica]|uniref:Uncharacterized protein n=1 Tax=Brassica cretica TaxID=69181 RepID=A0A8S9PBH7_BRACR|nr:hypothetical protein F2Q69_00008377 [Brassica cretica]
MERLEVFRSILLQEGMENEVGSVLGEHDADWSTPSSPTRVAEPRRASTRDEWRGIVNPRTRRGRSEMTPRRGVERRGFPYPRCRREPVDGVTRSRLPASMMREQPRRSDAGRRARDELPVCMK